MFKRLFTAALLFGLASHAPPAVAQAVCAPREVIVQRLADGYAEQLAGIGLQGATRMIEVWASHDSGSFTVLASRADGVSCVIATGQSWQQHSLRSAAPDRPS